LLPELGRHERAEKMGRPSRFEAVVDTALCSGCETCIERTSIGLKCIACDASYTVAGTDTIDTPCPQCGQKNGD
jgi:Zn finger protein HypA/HybF involved in hydrogenase expression